MTKTTKGGILLLVAGIALLFNQLGVIPGDIFLLTLGLGFCLAYALLGGRKEYGSVGFLIPGMVLLAIGVFAALQSRQITGDSTPGFFFLSLGLSFLGVFIIHTFWFKELDHGERFWPLYPAGGLIIFAVLLTLQDLWDMDFPLQALNYIWITVLLGAGLWLILGSRKSKEKS